MNYIIVGGSAAGINAIEAIRSVDKKSKITLISEEDFPLYSRCLLSYFLAGTIPEEKLRFRPKDFYKKHKVETVLGKKVEKVLPDSKDVQLSKGEKSKFDKLLIATGSSSKMIDVPGMDKKGIFALRTIRDAQGIMELLPAIKTVAVLGGGLIGLRAAYALHRQKKKIKVIVKSKQVLSQMLDAEGAGYVQRKMQSEGIDIMTGLAAKEVLGKERVEGLMLDDGSRLDCQLVIVGKGVRANIDLVKDTHIKTQWGIIVDEHLATNVADIYAAGDVAQTFDIAGQQSTINAIWPCASQQGRIAGLNMAGKETIYDGSMGMNSLEFFGLPTISMGVTRPKEEKVFEELVRKERQVYKKIVLKENRVVGMVFVGSISNAGVIGLLIRKRIDVSSIRHLLLEDRFDYGKIMELIKEKADKFAEREFRETVLTY